MDIEPQITFHHIKHSPALESLVKKKMARLERFFDHIISCRVALEHPQNDPVHNDTHRFRVRIDVTVPNHELVVTKTERDTEAHQGIRTGIRSAFDAMERQLKEYSARVRIVQQPDDLRPKAPPVGYIEALYENYGLIQAASGRRLIFDAEAVTMGDFEALEVGQDVRFRESQEPNAEGKAEDVQPYEQPEALTEAA